MGLAVSVGVLASGLDADPEGAQWLRESLGHVNRVLSVSGLPSHVEPETLPAFQDRGQPHSFPYSWLHYLRRAVAFARQAPAEFAPVNEGENPAEDQRIDEELCVYMDSHLICHSDCEGFYVPIDFPQPLYDDQEEGLPGGILGSSQRALGEVIGAAPLIGIPLLDGTLSDEEARKIAEEPDGSHPYWIERKTWLTMHEAFRYSIEHRCAVVFN